METITELEQKILVRQAITELVDFMSKASASHTAERFPTLKPDLFWVEGGKKYIKIAQGPGIEGAGASVHCFVDALTGDVYKAAGWKAPALNGARYNLLDPESLELLHSRFDVYGSYLYKR